MFKVEISFPQIRVTSRHHQHTFSIDNSHPNPLEALYAALAGCAGVYALKASKKLDKDPNSIRISGRVYNRPDNPLLPGKWVTTVSFSDDWSQQDADYILEEIKKCAVKELICNGADITFITEIA